MTASRAAVFLLLSFFWCIFPTVFTRALPSSFFSFLLPPRPNFVCVPHFVPRVRRIWGILFCQAKGWKKAARRRPLKGSQLSSLRRRRLGNAGSGKGVYLAVEPFCSHTKKALKIIIATGGSLSLNQIKTVSQGFCPSSGETVRTQSSEMLPSGALYQGMMG